MKVLFACGGTAGHINPAIAVATELRRRVPDCEILFVGNPDGMEATLVPRAGFRFAPFRSLGIQRRRKDSQPSGPLRRRIRRCCSSMEISTNTARS